MLQVNYDLPEGYGYGNDEFEIDSSKTYEERYEEIYNALINDEFVCAKVVNVSKDFKTLYLDFGAGIKGICNKNYVSDINSYWVNEYLINKFVNVKISEYNSYNKKFICSRDIYQRQAIQIQNVEYIPGRKVKGKILGYNRKIVIVDIGAGNLIVVPITLFKHCWLTPQKEYINFIIGTFNQRFNNFRVSVDDGREKLLFKVRIISKIDEGYLVSYVDEPSKHNILKSKKELDIGQVIIANLQKLKFTNTVLLYYSECKD